MQIIKLKGIVTNNKDSPHILILPVLPLQTVKGNVWDFHKHYSAPLSLLSLQMIAWKGVSMHDQRSCENFTPALLLFIFFIILSTNALSKKLKSREVWKGGMGQRSLPSYMFFKLKHFGLLLLSSLCIRVTKNHTQTSAFLYAADLI
jgi:hypothetical protein